MNNDNSEPPHSLELPPLDMRQMEQYDHIHHHEYSHPDSYESLKSGNFMHQSVYSGISTDGEGFFRGQPYPHEVFQMDQHHPHSQSFDSPQDHQDHLIHHSNLQHQQGFMFPQPPGIYQHQQQQYQQPYMNPLHMQSFHELNPQFSNSRFMPHREFAPFAPIPLTLIEGGMNENEHTAAEFGPNDSSIHPEFGSSFMHPELSPSMEHNMMGLVGIGPDGSTMRFEKRPDSPNAWGWVTADHTSAISLEGPAPAAEATHYIDPGLSGVSRSGACDPTDLYQDMDPLAASAAAAAAAASNNEFLLDRSDSAGGMSGAPQSVDGSESGFTKKESGSDTDSKLDKNLRRGKGAIYCLHRKLLYRCDECSSLGNPSHVITRVSAICHHGKRRSQCIQCYDEGTGGSIICEHRRQKYACPKCFDAGRETNSLCSHRTIKFKCKICSPAVHQPKTYRKRNAKSEKSEKTSPYPAGEKKRGPKRGKSNNSNDYDCSAFEGNVTTDYGSSIGGGEHTSHPVQQQPMFYRSHPNMMYHMQSQSHQMPQHGSGTGQVPGYMFHSAPVNSASSQNNSSVFINTPQPTRQASPELNKMTGRQSAFAPVNGVSTGAGVQLLVPTMVPLSFPAVRSVPSATLTPIVSPPIVNASTGNLRLNATVDTTNSTISNSCTMPSMKASSKLDYEKDKADSATGESECAGLEQEAEEAASAMVNMRLHHQKNEAVSTISRQRQVTETASNFSEGVHYCFQTPNQPSMTTYGPSTTTPYYYPTPYGYHYRSPMVVNFSGHHNQTRHVTEGSSRPDTPTFSSRTNHPAPPMYVVWVPRTHEQTGCVLESSVQDEDEYSNFDNESEYSENFDYYH